MEKLEFFWKRMNISVPKFIDLFSGTKISIFKPTVDCSVVLAFAKTGSRHIRFVTCKRKDNEISL